MLQAYHPPPHLSLWLEGAVSVRMQAHQGISRFPAMPRAMLTVHLTRGGGDRWCIAQPATFHAFTTRPSAYPPVGNITALGLIVKPAAAACLLGRAGAVVTNLALPWGVVAGESEALRLAEDIERSSTEAAGLQRLMASFGRAMDAIAIERWQQTHRLCEAVGQTGAAAGDFVGVGRRQLERRCLAVLGVSPKQFARLERFHRALAAVMSHDHLPLAHAALEAGYFDQSHLARDARELGGAGVREMKSNADPGASWWALSTPRAMRAAAGEVLL